ncbi:hypothetical protein [Roseiconus lacunae]|uniref:Uncharacterized protein n=1 Tax=Roseiconus lacunae TaxID=2605694 RepID=A0ABT7PMI8_9BACT|nr:hypothetical protein [Roseiconus lacunae]MDM4017702.1 hypothetical protein [Roseiconus lacunae]
MFQTFQPLPPVDRSGGRVERSVAFIDRSPVVVFEKQGQSLAPAVDCDWEAILGSYDCGPAICLESSGWEWSTADKRNFNCHALAIGSSVGLGPDQWLEGLASPATMHHNPVGTLLARCFERISSKTVTSKWRSAIREHDVFVCYDRDHDHYVHSGFLKWVAGIPMAISKFGEGPIMITTLKLIERFYQGAFDELRWYRPKESTQRRKALRSLDQGDSHSLTGSDSASSMPFRCHVTATVAFA